MAGQAIIINSGEAGRAISSGTIPMFFVEYYPLSLNLSLNLNVKAYCSMSDRFNFSLDIPIRSQASI